MRQPETLALGFRTPLTSIDPHIVRAYDLRGRASDQLTPQTVYWIGRAIAAKLGPLNSSGVCVGADGRESGPELKHALIAGLREGALDVIDLGYCATPVVYFAAAQQPHMNAVVLTASHNPADQNGIKLVLNNQAQLDHEIVELAHTAVHGPFSSGAGTLREHSHDAAYVHAIAQRYPLKTGLKVVVDCANGIGGPVTKMLFKQLKTRLSLLFAEVDGLFPNHSPDPCVADNLVALKQAVILQHADVGFALDGDADRIVAVTSSGRQVAADQILMLLAADMLESRKGLVLMDAKCSSAVRERIELAGGTVQMGRTGHSPMKRLMQLSGALCGGEFSAHYYFKDWYGFDDALFTAVRLLDLLQRKACSLDELIQALPQRQSTPEIRIEVDDRRKFELIERLATCDFNAVEINRVDGLRVEYANGWGLVRASNTEPALVMRFEANDSDEINKIITEFNEKLKQIDANVSISAFSTEPQGGSYATQS